MASFERTSLIVSTFAPFPTLNLLLPSSTPISSVYPLLAGRYPALPVDLAPSLVLTTQTGHAALPDDLLSSLHSDESNLVSLRLVPRLLGGKGGFGSQLRAAGGRMSSQKTNNNDSCRDLSGRRLSTIREAKKLAEYLDGEPERLAAKAEAQKAKLQALERKLGIDPNAKNGESSSSGAPPEVLAGKKHKLDAEYVEQTKEISENVKSAVAAAFLKKKKKAKLNHGSNNDAVPPKEKKASSKTEAKDETKRNLDEKKTEKEPAEDESPAIPAPIVATPLDSIGA